MNSGDIVQHSELGRGTVIGVFFDGSASVDFSGEKCGVMQIELELLESAPPPEPLPLSRTQKRMLEEEKLFVRYSTDYERALRPFIPQWNSAVAWIIGWAAEHNAFLRWSGQLNTGNEEIDIDEFEEFGNSHGEKFDVIMSNPNYIGLDDLLDINFIQSRVTLKRVSLNKEGFWKFLASLGFEIGREKEQNVEYIRTNIPSEWLADFDMGVRGTTL